MPQENRESQQLEQEATEPKPDLATQFLQAFLHEHFVWETSRYSKDEEND